MKEPLRDAAVRAMGWDAPAPDAIEPVPGWRVLVLRDPDRRDATGYVMARHGPRPAFPPLSLHSLNGTAWPAGRPLRAECRLGEWRAASALQEHEAPDRRCTCGVYATSSLGRLLEQFPGAADEGSEYVVARVEATGRVVIGDGGWRAQFARPAVLYVHEAMGKERWLRVGRAARLYGARVDWLRGVARARVSHRDEGRIPVPLGWGSVPPSAWSASYMTTAYASDLLRKEIARGYQKQLLGDLGPASSPETSGEGYPKEASRSLRAGMPWKAGMFGIPVVEDPSLQTGEWRIVPPSPGWPTGID